MDTKTLVTMAMDKAGSGSLRDFAKKIGVSHGAVYQWLNGDNVPTFEQAAELAVMAGLDPVSTAAKIRMESKDGAKHRTLLRRLATAAMITLMVSPIASMVWAHQDSNLEPKDYESSALTVEL